MPPRRRSALHAAAVFIRRTTQLTMDALLLIIFAPLITGWWMVGRLRRRTPGA